MLAPNHFSQMDHFFIGLYLRRKIRFMAKSQIFGPPVLTYVFKHGGVFPVRRGHHDEEAFKTAVHAPRPRSEMLLIYAEGGRSRSGELGEPKAGDRAPRARIGRTGGPGRDPRLGVGAALEALQLPEGDRPVRRAAQLPGRDRRRRTSASSRWRGDLRPGEGDVCGPRRAASFTSTQRGLRKTRSPPLTFRPTWAGESRANEQQR